MSKNRILIFILIGSVILIGVGFNYFQKLQNTKLIGTINCGLSKIDVRLDLRPNPLEGDGASYIVQYSTSEVKNMTLGGGPLINVAEWNNYILPSNTDINISTYASSNSNYELVLGMPNDKLASHTDIKYKFSQSEFEYLDSCLQKNTDGLNTILATLPSSLPSGIRARATIVASAPKLTALVHVDGLQLQQLLQSAGISNQLVFSSESNEKIIRVSEFGALKFDYYSDVGLDIFSTDFSKPLPEEYSWLNEYKNSNVSLMDYLKRVQQKVPIVFSE